MAGVALMDARSIAATAVNGGRLTAATDLDISYTHPQYFFDGSVYEKRVYNGFGKPEPEHEPRMGPNIKDWPEQPALSDGPAGQGRFLHYRSGSPRQTS